MNTCACGCGAPVKPGRRFIYLHHTPPKRWEDYPEPIADGDCLRWQGPHGSKGYGICGRSGNPSGRAHRAAWIRAFGPIPDGLVIDHVVARGCRFKDCVNVAHLEAVTSKENSLRGGVRPRIHRNTKKQSCARGHPYDKANTRLYTGKNGSTQRICRACVRESVRRYRQNRTKPSTTTKE